MGMDLRSVAGGTERFSNASWLEVLKLAYEHGWKPAGTEPGDWRDPVTGESVEQLCPDPGEWDGNYLTNDLQWVTEEDASRIADALERALNDIPEYLSGEGKQKIRAFIGLCRSGPFYIG